MALNKSLASESDVINIFEAEGTKEVMMGIKADKAAHILNRLIDAYTKPQEATVREIVSNATDATVLVPLADRKPIEITSPSTFKPSLTVRDCGVGMTPELVDEVFLQFGGSTKELDFSQIGAFGLGAKSPLSYCSEFSVSTTRDGVTTDVLISRKAEGPSAKILSVRKTDEPNGTIVTIPVRMEDRSDFVAALESYRKYSFDVELSIDGTISNNTENFINFDKIILEEESNTEGRVWVNKNSLTRLFKNAFVQPGYGYRYDSITTRYSLSGWIYSDPDSAGDSYHRRNEQNYDVIIELKPGVVDFSTSRDEITKNERSKALSDISAAAIVKNPEYIFKNIMKGYSALTDKEAYAFAAELIELIDPVKTDDKMIHFGGAQSPATMSVEISEFVTSTGFNPFELILKRHEKNVVAIVGYGSGNYAIFQDGLPNAREELLKTRPELKMFYRSETWSAAGDRRVGTVNAHLAELVENGEQKESLVDFIAENVRTQRHSKPVFSVVTGVDEKSIKKINARRKIMADKIFRNELVLFTNLDSIPKDQIDLAQTVTNEEIKFITADELIEKANEIRKEIAKLNPVSNKASELVYLNKLDISKLTSKADVIKEMSRGCSTEKITLDDLMASDAILLIGDQRHHRNTLIGAANAGVKIVGRDIYYTGYNANFKAAHYEKLKNYEGVFVSKDWNYNSIAFQHIAAVRSYHEVALNEEIDKMSQEKVVSMYLMSKSRNCGNPFLKFLKTSTTEDADNEIFALMAEAAILEEYPSFSPDFLLKVLTKRLGEEKARKVRAFVDSSSTFRSGNFTDVTVLALMRFSGSILPGESMAIAARDVFIDRYRTRLEQILADEAAALKAAAEIVDAVDLTVDAS